MRLFNPNGIVRIRVRNISFPNRKPVLEVLQFDGIIWGNNSFVKKWYSNTGAVIHFLGLRFSKHLLYDGMFYLTAKDKQLLAKFERG